MERFGASPSAQSTILLPSLYTDVGVVPEALQLVKYGQLSLHMTACFLHLFVVCSSRRRLNVLPVIGSVPCPS